MKTVKEIEEHMDALWSRGDHVGWSTLWWIRRDILRSRGRLPYDPITENQDDQRGRA